MQHILKGALAGGLCMLAACGPDPAGTVTVHSPWARETTTGVKVSAGYARIDNGTNEAVRLVGAESPAAARVEIHSVTTDGGIMRMRPLEGGLEIAAGDSVELKPGGYHFMMTGLRQPLRAGQSVPVTLQLDGFGPLQADFAVLSADDAATGGGHE